MERGNDNGDDDGDNGSDEEVRITRKRSKNIVYMHEHWYWHWHWHTCVFIFYFQCVTMMINFYLCLNWTKYIFTFSAVCMVFYCLLFSPPYSPSHFALSSFYVFTHNSFQFFSCLNHISLPSSSCTAAQMDGYVIEYFFFFKNCCLSAAAVAAFDLCFIFLSTFSMRHFRYIFCLDILPLIHPFIRSFIYSLFFTFLILILIDLVAFGLYGRTSFPFWLLFSPQFMC